MAQHPVAQTGPELDVSTKMEEPMIEGKFALDRCACR